MKKALLKLLLKLAIAVAIWSLKDQTKEQINQTVADRITAMYRVMMGKLREQEQNIAPDVREDNARRGPLRRFIDRILGRSGGDQKGHGVPLDD